MKIGEIMVKKEKKDKKDNKNIKIQKAKKESFIKGVKQELSKVKWPDFKTMYKYSITTILFCLLLSLMFYFLDVIFAFIKGMFS